MKKSKFTGEQIAFALRQAEVGTSVAEKHANRRGDRTRGSFTIGDQHRQIHPMTEPPP